MIRIALLSDTHGFLDPTIFTSVASSDEIWHAGDVGNTSVLDQLSLSGKTIRAVYGNIDGKEVRLRVPADLYWEVEGMKVWMTHIGGYPGHYAPGIKDRLAERRPDIFICGHSHILKVIYDKSLQLLHLNPGACGNVGFHQVKTLLRFSIDAGLVKDMEVVEWGRR